MLKLVNPNAATSENVKIWGKSHLSPIHGALHKARVKTIWKLDWKLILHHQSKFMRRFYWIEWKVQKWQYNDPSWCNKWHYLKLFTDCLCQWSKDYLFHRPTPNNMWKVKKKTKSTSNTTRSGESQQWSNHQWSHSMIGLKRHLMKASLHCIAEEMLCLYPTLWRVFRKKEIGFSRTSSVVANKTLKKNKSKTIFKF